MVRHWGEMGARWGISRSVAQVHALLHFAARPIPADEIAETLNIARSNVSGCLKELQGWGVVRLTHLPGDRREHFESINDVWRLFEVLLDERKRREVDPTLKALRECSAQEGTATKDSPETQRRLSEMLEFFEMMDAWYGEIRRMPIQSRVRLVKAANRIRSWLG
jgi:DNA-binding transcriptional regulator GbsR (MarR family)